MHYTVDVQPGESTNAAASPFTYTGLTNGTQYRFRVKACNAIGCSEYGGWSSYVTPSTVPGKPGAPSASAGNGSATVTWSAPSTGGSAITEYTIDADPGGSKTDNASPLNYTGLSNGTSYRFRVRACNANGCGSWSNWSGSVTPVAPKVATLSKGSSAQGQPGCSSSNCYYLKVSASGFPANTTVEIKCIENGATWYTYTRTTNSSGSIGNHQVCYYGYPGSAVKVKVGNVFSNTINW